MSKKIHVAIQKARDQESKKGKQNEGQPKKATKLQPSSIPPQDAKPVKKRILKPSCETNQAVKVTTFVKTRILKPLCNTNKSLKHVREPVRKKSVLKQVTIDGLHVQSLQTYKIDHAHGWQFEQQRQDYEEVEDTDTKPIDIADNRETRSCEIAHANVEQFEQQMQDYGEIKDTNATPINIEENRERRTNKISQVQVEQIEQQIQDYREVKDTNTIHTTIEGNIEPRTCKIVHGHVEKFEQQMQDYIDVENKAMTPRDIEEKLSQEVKPMQLQRYETNMETRNKTNHGLEDGLAIVEALSLEEYYLSGGKMMAPAVRDFIGPVKINKVGDGRGRGLVLTRDVVAGDLLIISNHIAKANKVKTETLEGNFTLEAGCWTASHHVLAEHLVAILSTQGWRSSRNRAILSTLCCRGGEELPVPPMHLFQHNLTPRTMSSTIPFNQNEIARLCGVVQCNAFGHTHISRQNNNITKNWSCGIWTLPSFINHSCIPNVATVLIGDAMIVVASRNLHCGDELTVAYFDIFRPLQERRTNMLHSWNFVCHCARCVLEETLQDTLMQITQAYSLREAEAAMTMQILRANYWQHGDETWSPYSVIDLAQLAEYIEEILHYKKLSRDKKNWIRASFLSAYLADGRRLMVDVRGLEEPRRCKYARKTHIQTALAAAKTVTPGHPQTLQIAVVILKRAVQAYGRRSFLVENAHKRTLGVCVRMFGRQPQEVLDRIIDVTARDVLVSSVVFFNRPEAEG